MPERGDLCNDPHRFGLTKNKIDSSSNIIDNHDFSNKLEGWHANHCDAYIVVGRDPCTLVNARTGNSYAVVRGRKKELEQQLTSKISPNLKYNLCAWVRVFIKTEESEHDTEVKLSLKVRQPDGVTASNMHLKSAVVSQDEWEKLECSFTSPSMFEIVIFYLWGPSDGVDLLVDSVEIYPSNPLEKSQCADIDGQIIMNPHFENACDSIWAGRGCKICKQECLNDGEVLPWSGKFFASAIQRGKNYYGIQQGITGRVRVNTMYNVTAMVRIFGGVCSADVRATVWVIEPSFPERYISIGNVQASDKEWRELKGKFFIRSPSKEFRPSRAIIYVEGPPQDTDILIDSFIVNPAEKIPSSFLSPEEECGEHTVDNAITNHDFSEGLASWICSGSVHLGNSNSNVKSNSGENYAIVLGNKDSGQWLKQNITAKLSSGSFYIILAYFRASEKEVEVIAKLKLKHVDSEETSFNVGRSIVPIEKWEKLEGHFFLSGEFESVVLCFGCYSRKEFFVDSVLVFSPKQSSPIPPHSRLIEVLDRNNSLDDATEGNRDSTKQTPTENVCKELHEELIVTEISNLEAPTNDVEVANGERNEPMLSKKKFFNCCKILCCTSS